MSENLTFDWGGKPYTGLNREWEPDWFLTDEQRELQQQLIEVCEKVIRPNAIICDRTGEYPQKSVEALAELHIQGGATSTVVAARTTSAS